MSNSFLCHCLLSRKSRRLTSLSDSRIVTPSPESPATATSLLPICFPLSISNFSPPPLLSSIRRISEIDLLSPAHILQQLRRRSRLHPTSFSPSIMPLTSPARKLRSPATVSSPMSSSSRRGCCPSFMAPLLLVQWPQPLLFTVVRHPCCSELPSLSA